MIDSIERRQMFEIGHQHCAIGMANIAGKFGAPPRWVDSHYRRAGKGGATDPEKILGRVVQQHADVLGCVTLAGSLDQRRTAKRLGQHLIPGVGDILEHVPRTSVAATGEEEFRHTGHRSRPKRSAALRWVNRSITSRCK